MPNPLGIPLRKRNKSSPMCDTWGIGCQGFLLWSRPSLPGCKLVQNPQQQLSSQKGLFSVQAIHRESAGQIESFLRENSASVDRKSTRLNSSHQIISYAVFCLKK